MKKKYSYCEKHCAQLEQYLIAHKIKHKIVGDNILVPKLISFVTFEDISSDPKICRFFQGSPIISNEFTSKELLSATHLTIRPTKNIVNIQNVEEAFSFSCLRSTLWGNQRFEHREQIASFKIKKITVKNTPAFFSSDTGYGEIFAKKTIREIVCNNNITGIQLNPVFEQGKNSDVESNLYQLVSQQIIPVERIFIDKMQRFQKCPICGKPRILCTQDFQLCLMGSAFDFPDDFYMTETVFGEGFSYPLFIVSQKLYRLLTDSNMVRNVSFEPVLFVNCK